VIESMIAEIKHGPESVCHNTYSMRVQTVCMLLFFSSRLLSASLSPLLERGYMVMPEPQRVTMGRAEFQFGRDWRLEVAPGASEAVLLEELESRFHLKFNGRGTGGSVLRLRIAPKSVIPGPAQDKDKSAIAEQAYAIDLTPNSVTISANAPAGLFYGVETFVQLLKPRDGALWLPQGYIEDWPDLQLRQIYWDDAH